MAKLTDFHRQQLPTRGRKVPNSCFQREFASWNEKLGEIHLFRGSLHSCIFRLNFSWALLPMVSSPFCLTLRSRQFWSILSQLCRTVALVLGDRDVSHSGDVFLSLFGFRSLVWLFLSFLFFYSFFSELVSCVCYQCNHQGGDWGPERPRTGGWSLLSVMSDWQRGVDWLLAEYCRCRLRLDLH
jgi:hypothetical protein